MSQLDIIMRDGTSRPETPMRVVVVRNSDGARVEDRPDWREPGHRHYTWDDLFWWTEGNMGCDCNRHLVFERAQGREPPDEECVCGTTRYHVVLSPGEAT